LVAAASDLIDIKGFLAQGFTVGKVQFTFGASGNLAQQVKNGAPYDVFLSADEQRVKELTQAGNLIPASVAIYAQGRIAIWSKSGKVAALDALQSPGILHVAIANPTHAPYGAAAKQALERAGLWAKLEGRIVYGENVRQALEYAENGSADAVSTAWSLLVNRGGILLPANLHNPIRQAGGVVRNSKNPGVAQAFLRFLVSPEGQRILTKNGFDSPEPTRP